MRTRTHWEPPDLDELVRLRSAQRTFEELGIFYGVSSDTVRKWCKKWNLTNPDRPILCGVARDTRAMPLPPIADNPYATFEPKKFEPSPKTFEAPPKAFDRSPPVEEVQDETDGEVRRISLKATPINTPEQLVSKLKIDPARWFVDKFGYKNYMMGYKDADSNPDSIDLYSVSAVFKRQPNTVTEAADCIRELIAKLETCPPLYQRSDFPRLDGGLYGVGLNISDLHAGKLAWEGETRQNFDVNIAVNLFHRATDLLIRKTDHYDIEEFILPVGNDLFHSDNPRGTTYAGTQLDVDGRFFRTFDRVADMVIGQITRLRQRAKVQVIMVPGNHDTMSVHFLGRMLKAVFREVDDVEIDTTLWERKYVAYGLNVIGLSHGDKGKRADLPLVMCREAQRLYGDSKHQEIWCGHLHTLKQDEKNGFITRLFPSLSGTDVWHHQMQFVGNTQRAEAVVLAREGRLEGNLFTQADEIERYMELAKAA